MKLKYETGIATLIQFIIISFLNIATGANSVISTCSKSGTSDCITNLLTSVVYFLLLTAWFGGLWVLGYAAQDRRSKRFAQALIAAEGLVALIALFNAKHHPDFIGLVTSLADLLLALWIIVLAFRLMQAGGKRITIGRRRRHANLK